MKSKIVVKKNILTVGQPSRSHPSQAQICHMICDSHLFVKSLCYISNSNSETFYLHMSIKTKWRLQRLGFTDINTNCWEWKTLGKLPTWIRTLRGRFVWGKLRNNEDCQSGSPKTQRARATTICKQHGQKHQIYISRNQYEPKKQLYQLTYWSKLTQDNSNRTSSYRRQHPTMKEQSKIPRSRPSSDIHPAHQEHRAED